MSLITVVTAFYDINRDSFSPLKRNNNKYIEYFKFWAGIKNRLIVFTQDCFKDEIIQIRKGYGLEEDTTVIVINDIFQIHYDLYKKMNEISINHYFRNFRLYEDATSNNADYSYLMMMKSWFVHEASNYCKSDYYAWVDFGFNHGGKILSQSKDFEFYWDYNFPQKICLFYRGNYSQVPIYEIVRNQTDCLMGAIYVVPHKLAEIFYRKNIECMNSLVDIGFIDDDQLILMMISRKWPELCQLYQSDWFLPIKEYGNENMKVRTNTTYSFLKRKMILIYKLLNKKKIIDRYIKRERKLLWNILR